MPANASFDKGAAVEEWSDVHFFRPLGLRVARACMPTGISPDHVTIVALVTGLIAGNMLFYQNTWINAAGVAMFVLSDIFDSADGQLARMRGTSTRLGRMLDGLSDSSRFGNLYLTLMARMLVHGTAWWIAIPFGAAAGLAHSWQSASADGIKQFFLHIVQDGDGELDLPEDEVAIDGNDWFARWSARAYAGYVRRQAALLPNSATVVRTIRRGRASPLLPAEWREREYGPMRQCAWIGQNIRFLLLALMVVPGHPMWYLGVTLVPMSVVAVAIVRVHERRAASLAPELVAAAPLPAW
jgi:hypothetical protein